MSPEADPEANRYHVAIVGADGAILYATKQGTPWTPDAAAALRFADYREAIAYAEERRAPDGYTLSLVRISFPVPWPERYGGPADGGAS